MFLSLKYHLPVRQLPVRNKFSTLRISEKNSNVCKENKQTKINLQPQSNSYHKKKQSSANKTDKQLYCKLKKNYWKPQKLKNILTIVLMAAILPKKKPSNKTSLKKKICYR